MNRSPWNDPNVKAALKQGRPASDISLICCPECGTYGYYNDGSHFSCSGDMCGYSCRGDRLDALIDNGEVITLDDYAEMAAEEEQIP